MEKVDGRPDVASHVTGWDCKLIDGRWRIGMKGNLDTIHDAVLVVNSGPLGGTNEAEHLARWVVAQYNAAESDLPKTPPQKDEQP